MLVARTTQNEAEKVPPRAHESRSAASSPDHRLADLEGGGKLVIEWREQNGPPAVRPRQRGLGSLMLECTLVRDLDGRAELAFEPAGVVCRIEMPISDPGGHACLG